MYFNKYFFLLLCAIFACSKSETKRPPEIVWADNKAIEIILSNPSLADLPEVELSKSIRVELGDTNEPMLGQFFRRDGNVAFQPVVPFSRGMHYHIFLKGEIIEEVDIPVDENAKTPELSVFPSSDTVPENILKMYLKFSEPMVEGKSYRHIQLLRTTGDTLAGTFLDLQPELWNDEGTILTLWFDPGRVKRDLIPNKTLGNPLIKGREYILHVSGKWKSKSGREIGMLTTKKFWVVERDEDIPDADTWMVDAPRAGTQYELRIYFSESLDFSLVQSAIQVLDSRGASVGGEFKCIDEEKGILFKPFNSWESGPYIIKVESRLEDLAGNNLSRPFDRDITKVATRDKEYFERKFKIE